MEVVGGGRPSYRDEPVLSPRKQAVDPHDPLGDVEEMLRRLTG